MVGRQRAAPADRCASAKTAFGFSLGVSPNFSIYLLIILIGPSQAHFSHSQLGSSPLRQFRVVCAMLYLVAQLCLTLCDLMDCSHQAPLSMGILQARILEWAAIFLLQGILPTPGIEPRSPALQADSLPFELPGKPNKCRRVGKSR